MSTFMFLTQLPKCDRCFRSVHVTSEPCTPPSTRILVDAQDVEVCEMRNLLDVSKLIVQSALERRESRGLHFTTDHLEYVSDTCPLPFPH